MTSKGKKEKKSYWTNTKPSFFVHSNFKIKQQTNKQINPSVDKMNRTKTLYIITDQNVAIKKIKKNYVN